MSVEATHVGALGQGEVPVHTMVVADGGNGVMAPHIFTLDFGW